MPSSISSIGPHAIAGPHGLTADTETAALAAQIARNKAWAINAPPADLESYNKVCRWLNSCARDSTKIRLRLRECHVRRLPEGCIPPHVTELDVSGMQHLLELPRITNPHAMRQIRAQGCHALEDASAVEECTYLETLNLNKCVAVHLPNFARMSKLVVLELKEVNVWRMPRLDGMTSLSTLNLNGCRMLHSDHLTRASKKTPRSLLRLPRNCHIDLRGTLAPEQETALLPIIFHPDYKGPVVYTDLHPPIESIDAWDKVVHETWDDIWTETEKQNYARKASGLKEITPKGLRKIYTEVSAYWRREKHNKATSFACANAFVLHFPPLPETVTEALFSNCRNMRKLPGHEAPSTLTTLRVKNCPRLHDTEALKDCTQLKKLVLAGTGIKAPPPRMRSIDNEMYELRLTYNRSLRYLTNSDMPSYLTGFPNLAVFSVTGSPVCEFTMPDANCHLIRISMQGHTLSPETQERMAQVIYAPDYKGPQVRGANLPHPQVEQWLEHERGAPGSGQYEQQLLTAARAIREFAAAPQEKTLKISGPFTSIPFIPPHTENLEWANCHKLQIVDCTALANKPALQVITFTGCGASIEICNRGVLPKNVAIYVCDRDGLVIGP
jgi:hypothetical protein